VARDVDPRSGFEFLSDDERALLAEALEELIPTLRMRANNQPLHSDERRQAHAKTGLAGGLLRRVRPRVSTNDVLAGRLPDDATGVHWQDTGWVECREHLTHDSWQVDVPNDDRVGVVLFGEVDCDMHREAAREEQERSSWVSDSMIDHDSSHLGEEGYCEEPRCIAYRSVKLGGDRG
jgi:hypothetical protein